MTKEQVQALRDAGVSETAIIDRILQETAPDPAPAPAPNPAPNPAPDPAPNPAPAPAPAPAPNPAPAPAPAPADRTDEILAAIDNLTGILQKSNLHSGRKEAAPQSVDDILASVLTPAKKK